MTRDSTAVRMQPSAWAEAAEVILRGGILADYAERKDELVLRGRLLSDQQALNAQGVAGPGGAWSPSTIHGHVGRGTGI